MDKLSEDLKLLLEINRAYINSLSHAEYQEYKKKIRAVLKNPN